MQPTYTITGADGKNYGPVSLDEIKSWIKEGRVTAETNVSRSDTNNWRLASQYRELAPVPNAPPPPAAPTAEMLDLEKKIRQGGSWFFWIAGVSTINAVSYLSGSDFAFFFGLGSLEWLNLLAREMGSTAITFAGALSSIAVILFVLFGVFACRKQSWAFILGMAIYGLDIFSFFLTGQYFCVAANGLALGGLFFGFRAGREWLGLQNSPAA